MLSLDEIRKANEQQRTVPFGQVEFVSLTMAENADTDTAVRHHLHPESESKVGYIVIQQSAAGSVYHDITPTRRVWATDTIYLRSNVASLRVVLLLFTPAIKMTSIISSL
jgi:hypothetical protein